MHLDLKNRSCNSNSNRGRDSNGFGMVDLNSSNGVTPSLGLNISLSLMNKILGLVFSRASDNGLSVL